MAAICMRHSQRSALLPGSPCAYGSGRATMIRQVQAHANAGVNFFELEPIYRSIPELISMMEMMAKEVFPACHAEKAVIGEAPPRKAVHTAS